MAVDRCDNAQIITDIRSNSAQLRLKLRYIWRSSNRLELTTGNQKAYYVRQDTWTCKASSRLESTWEWYGPLFLFSVAYCDTSAFLLV